MSWFCYTERTANYLYMNFMHYNITWTNQSWLRVAGVYNHSFLFGFFLKGSLLLNLWFPSQSQLTCGRARQEYTVMIILAPKAERMASGPGLVTSKSQSLWISVFPFVKPEGMELMLFWVPARISYATTPLSFNFHLLIGHIIKQGSLTLENMLLFLGHFHIYITPLRLDQELLATLSLETGFEKLTFLKA